MIEEQPNENVAVYFEEGMHCYALGLQAAAVALARACMEKALRDTVKVPFATQLDRDALVKAAGHTKMLDGALLQMAREVQRIGNQVPHRQRCEDVEAFDSIVNVRAVEQLYGAAGSQ